MATVDARLPDVEREHIKAEWLSRLANLFMIVEKWSAGCGWTARKITKSMQDVDLGGYEAPVLLLNGPSMEIIVDPISRLASGAEGVVDLCRLPAYDDVATFFFRDGAWHFYLRSSEHATSDSLLLGETTDLTNESLRMLLDEIGKNAS